MIINRSATLCWLGSVSSVGLNHLVSFELIHQSLAEDSDIRVVATHKGSIGMDNVTSINGYGHLISDAWTFELVRIPSRVERFVLIDAEVRPINCHHAPSIVTSSMILSVFPTNLQKE